MLFYQSISRDIHSLVPAFFHLAPELLIAIMCLEMRLLISICELFTAQVDIATELNLGQRARQVFRELHGAELLLTVRTGAFGVCPCPIRHAVLTEHPLTFRALLRFANDLRAHDTREMIVNLVHDLLFIKLG